MKKEGSFQKWFGEFKSYVREEFVAHLPYTWFGAFLGLVFVFSVPVVKPFHFGEREFHLAHFIHVFFSAAAGAAIFRSYKGTLKMALPVVYVSSVGLCSLSDSIIPFVGLRVFGTAAEVHLCVQEHPLLVSAFALAGFALGFMGVKYFRHCNRPFHLMHILISTIASALYMLSFVDVLGFEHVLAVLVTLFFALAIPCLVGDLVLPLCFVQIRDPYLHDKVHHSH